MPKIVEVSGVVDVTYRIRIAPFLTIKGNEKCALFRMAFDETGKYQIAKRIVEITIEDVD